VISWSPFAKECESTELIERVLAPSALNGRGHKARPQHAQDAQVKGSERNS
jgi:hypothetical protein